jgi:tetratricopeptide (TPR) repeat protein
VPEVLLLARALREGGDDAEAEKLLRSARLVRPGEAAYWDALGRLLEEQRPPRWPEALACYQTVWALRPELGAIPAAAMHRAERRAEARVVAEHLCRQQPENPRHFHLLIRINDLYQWDRAKEREAVYREALRHHPSSVLLHYHLAQALREQGKSREEEAEYRAIVRLDRDFSPAHGHLGHILWGQGRYREAEEAFREVARTMPDSPNAYITLGALHLDQGQPEKAVVAFRKVVELRPNHSLARMVLGNTLFGLRRDEAEAEFRALLRVRPDDAEALCNLGHALLRQGRFVEALEALRRGHKIGSQHPDWPHATGRWVEVAERMPDLDGKLPAVLKGGDPGDTAQQLGLAYLCQIRYELYATSARLYARAFTADPKLADDLGRQHRYNAACMAALAAAGQGKDADQIDVAGRARLRRQALDWLQDDLKLWSRQIDGDDPKQLQRAGQVLQHWKRDRDLAALRDPDAVAKLLPDEREACRRLWAEVERLLSNANK